MNIIFISILLYCTIISAQTNPIQPLTIEIEELPTETVEVKVATPTVLMIDDFEDGEFIQFRKWWSFGKVIISAKENEETEPFLNKTSMNISASTYNWYAGGIGTYLNENAEYFDTIKLVIYSPKLNSGSLRIELYDDDNNNHIVDIDKDTSKPSKDDLFIYDLNLTFKGWKVISIPLIDFVDYNTDIGDNIWNPNKLYGSSGLTQMQILILSSKYNAETIEFKIDTIKFN